MKMDKSRPTAAAQRPSQTSNQIINNLPAQALAQNKNGGIANGVSPSSETV